jgi:hypothetical protein
MLLAGALIAAFTLADLIELPYSISTTGRVAPSTEWLVVRTQDGGIVSTLYDNVRGLPMAYQASQTSRGDNLIFSLSEGVVPGATVDAGDTVGVIQSTDIDLQLARLNGELASETALLAVYRTGQKESVIEAASHRLLQAGARVEHRARQVERTRALFHKSAVSQEELEAAENQLRLDEIQVEIEEAQLKSEQSGDAQPQIDWIRSRIEAIQAEIRVLQDRRTACAVRTPIAGRIATLFSRDTLLVVQDTCACAVGFPLRSADRGLVEEHQEVQVSVPGAGHPLVATVRHIGNAVHTVNGQQLLRMVALTEPGNGRVAPGTIVTCSVTCRPLPLTAYLAAILSH